MSRTVVVVGGGGGIGSEIARSVYQLGYDILAVDRQKPRRRVRHIREWVSADLSTAGSAERVAEQILESADRIWGLVYAAGIYPIEPFDTYRLARWKDVIAVNLDAAFRLARALVPALKPDGRIVFVASAAGHLGSRDVAYSVSKAGLLGLTRSLAKNLAKESILVNAVCPGIIDTPMSRRMSARGRRSAVAGSLLGRIGTVREVAVAVEFLLEPRNTYMTGSCIAVDGGATHF